MLIALIADAYPPMRSSAAVQLRDLSIEFVRQGHFPIVMIPSADLDQPWLLEVNNGVQVLRLKAPRTKDIGYVRRTLGEFFLPYIMLKNLRKSQIADIRWDAVVWYSPSIFLGPLVKKLKKTSSCKSYLILRDLFPEWALDMGLMSKGLPYWLFKSIANYQYSLADIIGIQTHSNKNYIAAKSSSRIEVLQNWLANAPNVGCSIHLAGSKLAGRTIFVYAGNMGVAQGMDVLLELVERLLHRADIGFLFVGRGSEFHRLSLDAKRRRLCNVMFKDEIDPTEIPGLYAQCHIGLVALDPRHKTHNIPGKFLSYMQAGLPVLASINPNTDLEAIILREGVGRVCSDQSLTTLQRMAEELAEEVATGTGDKSFMNPFLAERCKSLSAKLFSPEVAVRQIVSAL